VVEKDYGIPPWASLGGAFTLSLVLPFLLVFFIAGPEQPPSAPAPSSDAHAPPTAKETPAQAKKGTPSKPSKENKNKLEGRTIHLPSKITECARRLGKRKK